MPNFVRCICEENELLFHTKISEIRHNGSFLVIFLVSLRGGMPSWILLLKVHKKSPFYHFLIAIGL